MKREAHELEPFVEAAHRREAAGLDWAAADNKVDAPARYHAALRKT